MNPLDLLLGARGGVAGPPPPRARPLTLEESKLMFRVAVQSASVGPLRFLTVRRMMMIAFGLGLTLGISPAARRGLGALITRQFPRKQATRD